MNKKKNAYVMSAEGKRCVRNGTLSTTLMKLLVLLPLAVIAFISESAAGVSGETWNNIGWYVLTGILLLVIFILLSRFQYRQMNIPTYHENERLRVALADKLLEIPLNELNQKGLAELSQNMIQDTNANEKILSAILPDIYSAALALPIMAFILAFFNPLLSVAIFIPIPVALLVLFLTMKKQESLTDQQIPVKRASTEALHEYVEGLYEIRTNGMLAEKKQNLDHLLKKMKQYSAKMELFSGVCVAGADVFLQLGTGLSICLVVFLLSEGKITFVETFFFLAVAITIYGPVTEVFGAIPSNMYFRKVTDRMRHLLEIPNMPGEQIPPILNETLSFEQVGFSYKEKSPVLQDVSFQLKTGTITALVGASGCGKTTVANLAARMWDPKQGRICLGDYDIRDLKQEYFYQHVSCVFQDVVLFHGTVLENIRMSRPDASEEEVKEAARLAYCESFIEKLPDGWQTVLAENGNSLSGGERQRIAIARAILKNAPILILDEATSHLDAENEWMVQKAIASVVRGKTVLIIAHRLRNIVDADQILVMDKGKIIEKGTHSYLLENCEVYRRMYLLQEKSNEWFL